MPRRPPKALFTTGRMEYTSFLRSQMAKTTEDRDVRARLSAQRALLGEVSPALRAVVLSVNNGIVEVRCYFDGPVRPQDEESISCVETEMIADCGPGEEVKARCIQLDAPKPISDEGLWVYYRQEREQ